MNLEKAISNWPQSMRAQLSIWEHWHPGKPRSHVRLPPDGLKLSDTLFLPPRCGLLGLDPYTVRDMPGLYALDDFVPGHPILEVIDASRKNDNYNGNFDTSLVGISAECRSRTTEDGTIVGADGIRWATAQMGGIFHCRVDRPHSTGIHVLKGTTRAVLDQCEVVGQYNRNDAGRDDRLDVTGYTIEEANGLHARYNHIHQLPLGVHIKGGSAQLHDFWEAEHVRQPFLFSHGARGTRLTWGRYQFVGRVFADFSGGPDLPSAWPGHHIAGWMHKSDPNCVYIDPDGDEHPLFPTDEEKQRAAGQHGTGFSIVV